MRYPRLGRVRGVKGTLHDLQEQASLRSTPLPALTRLHQRAGAGRLRCRGIRPAAIGFDCACIGGSAPLPIGAIGLRWPIIRFGLLRLERRLLERWILERRILERWIFKLRSGDPGERGRVLRGHDLCGPADV